MLIEGACNNAVPTITIELSNIDWFLPNDLCDGAGEKSAGGPLIRRKCYWRKQKRKEKISKKEKEEEEKKKSAPHESNGKRLQVANTVYVPHRFTFNSTFKLFQPLRRSQINDIRPPICFSARHDIRVARFNAVRRYS